VTAVYLSRRRLQQLVPHAEDCSGLAVPADNEALRLLIQYADTILSGTELSHPMLAERVEQHLIDLAALALGTNRDNAEAARHGGLRAARLESVLRLIRSNYSDPDISPASVAGRVGISVRYLHHLLHETGSSFAERVQDLRLGRACALLTGDPRGAAKVSDAAYAAGFNDLSHFNKMFRRKYGLTPTAARGAGIRGSN
jgi:AraC-like DNA-binding protein